MAEFSRIERSSAAFMHCGASEARPSINLFSDPRRAGFL